MYWLTGSASLIKPTANDRERSTTNCLGQGIIRIWMRMWPRP